MPRCLGWLKLSRDQILQLSTEFKCWPQHFDLDVMGIVIQYFPNSVPLTDSNITFELAEKVMRGLTAIHGCYVIHGDIDDDEKSILRNCLVTEQGQVIWIDFDQSHIPGSPSISSYIGTTKRVDFWLEIASCWRKFYSAMVGLFFVP